MYFLGKAQSTVHINCSRCSVERAHSGALGALGQTLSILDSHGGAEKTAAEHFL